jgi:Spx/MgsR family transcriptional regulator
MKLKFYAKPTCTTCRRAKSFLLDQGADLEVVGLNEGLTVEQLEELIGNRDYRLFLNFRNEIYRERRMKDKPPSRSEALRLMARHPNLIRRPIVARGKKLALGFDEEALRKVL